jgi:muramoyltetrapeptide carboxypeptidase
MKGHILVLEDTGERAYKVDRLMTQLRLSGALDEIAGLIVGEFSHVSEDQKAQITQFFEQFAEGLSVPVVSQMPIGHDILNAPLPLGHATGFLATLDAPRGREATLTFSKVA